MLVIPQLSRSQQTKHIPQYNSQLALASAGHSFTTITTQVIPYNKIPRPRIPSPVNRLLIYPY